MKFLLEIVWCCGRGRTARREEEESTRRLVPLPPRKHRRRRRRAAEAAGSAAEWKPSLGAISEDNTVGVVKADSAAAASAGDADVCNRTVEGSRRFFKRKVTGPRSRVHVRSRSDDYGQSQFPAVIPAFSPTPFMF